MFRFICRFILLPLCFSGSLILLMYLSDEPVSTGIGILFTLLFTGWILMWVMHSIKVWKLKYLSPRLLSKITTKTHLTQQTMQILTTKSVILYILMAGYIAISFAFACVYDALNLTTAHNLWENFYFSMTTITTVGYGDFIPKGLGQVFACLEMMTGLLYQVVAIGTGSAFLLNLEDTNKKPSSDRIVSSP